MKQAGYSKRPRGRSFERHRQPQKTQNGDASDGKIRGNPQQAVEKYLTLARDAASSGDPVSAENYYQYADHYYRLSLAARGSRVAERQEDRREGYTVASALDPSAAMEAKNQPSEDN